MDNILVNLRKELKNNRDLQKQKSQKRFFKEDVKLYGINTPTVNKIAKKYDKEILKTSKQTVFYICESLLKSGYLEESFIACRYVYHIREDFVEKDFFVFEDWINKYITNWATCDTFCNHTVGYFIEKYPKYIENIKKWTKYKNRWTRRASSVSFIIPAKKGKFIKDIFEISDLLLLDKDDLV